MTNLKKCCGLCLVKCLHAGCVCEMKPICPCYTSTPESANFMQVGNGHCYICHKDIKANERHDHKTIKATPGGCDECKVGGKWGIDKVGKIREATPSNSDLLLSKETEVREKIEVLRNKYPPSSKHYPQVAQYHEALDDILELLK